MRAPLIIIYSLRLGLSFVTIITWLFSCNKLRCSDAMRSHILCALQSAIPSGIYHYYYPLHRESPNYKFYDRRQEQNQISCVLISFILLIPNLCIENCA